MFFLPTVNKARKPKFEVHLRIKWHLPHSIHGEHRGRTAKCPIANHRVEYGYGKIVPVRIAIDRSNGLAECPIEFEVLQEFTGGGLGADEKIVLGKVTLNLTEYVEESEAILREMPLTSGTGQGGLASAAGSAVAGAAAAAAAVGGDHHHRLSFGHHRSRSSASRSGGAGGSTDRGAPASPASKESGGSGSSGTQLEEEAGTPAPEVRDGVIRRHLMQDSKINSTLKIGVLMVQIDGDRNYIAPPLKTAPVFGGIAGIGLTGDQADPDDSVGQIPSLSKSRDAADLQDMYRRSLAASWASNPTAPSELAADACIENIFGGGTGFEDDDDLDPPSDAGRHRPSSPSGRRTPTGSRGHQQQQQQQQPLSARFAPTSTTSTSTPWSLAARPFKGGGRGGGGGGGDDGSPSTEDDADRSGAGGRDGGSTLRPRDVRAFFHRSGGSSGSEAGQQQQQRQQQQQDKPSYHHRRQRSGTSDKSARTLVMTSASAGDGGDGGRDARSRSRARTPTSAEDAGTGGGQLLQPSTAAAAGVGRGHHRRNPSRTRSESLASLTTTVGSDHHRGRDGFRRAREVDEFEVRDDLVAWRLPGKVL